MYNVHLFKLLLFTFNCVNCYFCCFGLLFRTKKRLIFLSALLFQQPATAAIYNYIHANWHFIFINFKHSLEFVYFGTYVLRILIHTDVFISAIYCLSHSKMLNSFVKCANWNIKMTKVVFFIIKSASFFCFLTVVVQSRHI